jgi:hypothetical protein
LTITIINETSLDWQLSSILNPTDAGGTWKVTQSSPSTLFSATIGKGVPSMYQNFVTLGRGPMTLNYTYIATTSDGKGVFFGMQIVVPVQVHHVGFSPYCQVQYGTWDPSGNWTGPDKTSAQDLSFEGFKVHIDATAAGTVSCHQRSHT